MTSLEAISRRAISLPSGAFRSMEMQRLPRWHAAHTASPAVPGGREMFSTLMTSAPRSLRIMAANGPATAVPKSSTRIPSSGCRSAAPLAARGRLFQRVEHLLGVLTHHGRRALHDLVVELEVVGVAHLPDRPGRAG